jgi:hypothetical protein
VHRSAASSAGFNNVFEVNFGLTHTADLAKANMRAYIWDRMKDWLVSGAIETDGKDGDGSGWPGPPTAKQGQVYPCFRDAGSATCDEVEAET